MFQIMPKLVSYSRCLLESLVLNRGMRETETNLHPVSETPSVLRLGFTACRESLRVSVAQFVVRNPQTRPALRESTPRVVSNVLRMDSKFLDSVNAS